nr:DNA/RNA non-specific endonuclease [Hydrogenophaga sp. 2FB]
MDRNGYQQACAGKCGEVGDEGGHLIAAALGGAGDRINIVPQDSTMNRGEWRAMEREWPGRHAAAALRSPRSPCTSPGSAPPTPRLP